MLKSRARDHVAQRIRAVINFSEFGILGNPYFVCGVGLVY